MTPILPDMGESAGEAAAKPGGRWSFVWRPPSGEVCPECGFPLARFARRLKWMWMFRLGVMLLTAAFVLVLVQRFAGVGAGAGMWWVLVSLGGVGLLATVIGIAGLVVGGRREP
ncbi:MAG: hypothetical protein OER90_05795 [Gemmatimonadota bacterium]|nr:hypothetical protein [Gemmatimonadota bacterium]